MIVDRKHIVNFSKPDWGEYLQPSNSSTIQNNALRVVLFGSTLGGMWVLEALKKLKEEYGEQNIALVGLVTDDARLGHARISLKKRIWRYFNQDTRVEMVNTIINMGLNMGMEVFTGNVKTIFFENLLKNWNPDVIVMACFGQIVPISIFKYPKLGMYNFHPSDLKNDIGSGPKPFEDTISLGLTETKVSLMEVTKRFVDHGPMVAQSPSICITSKEGGFFEDVLIVEEKVTTVFPFMTEVLIQKLIEIKKHNLDVNSLKLDLDKEIDLSIQSYLLEKLSGIHGENYPFPDPKMVEYLHSTKRNIL